MEFDFDSSADAEAAAVEDSKAKELESMRKRLQEIEAEAGALREMQAKVEKGIEGTQGRNSVFDLSLKFKDDYGLVSDMETGN